MLLPVVTLLVEEKEQRTSANTPGSVTIVTIVCDDDECGLFTQIMSQEPEKLSKVCTFYSDLWPQKAVKQSCPKCVLFTLICGHKRLSNKAVQSVYFLL